MRETNIKMCADNPNSTEAIVPSRISSMEHRTTSRGNNPLVHSSTDSLDTLPSVAYGTSIHEDTDGCSKNRHKQGPSKFVRGCAWEINKGLPICTLAQMVSPEQHLARLVRACTSSYLGALFRRGNISMIQPRVESARMVPLRGFSAILKLMAELVYPDELSECCKLLWSTQLWIDRAVSKQIK